jgi:hypothetical protein
MTEGSLFTNRLEIEQIFDFSKFVDINRWYRSEYLQRKRSITLLLVYFRIEDLFDVALCGAERGVPDFVQVLLVERSCEPLRRCSADRPDAVYLFDEIVLVCDDSECVYACRIEDDECVPLSVENIVPMVRTLFSPIAGVR